MREKRHWCSNDCDCRPIWGENIKKDDYYVSPEAKDTARHIGIISEGALQTLVEQTQQDTIDEFIKEIEEIEKEKMAYSFSKPKVGGSPDYRDGADFGFSKAIKILKSKLLKE